MSDFAQSLRKIALGIEARVGTQVVIKAIESDSIGKLSANAMQNFESDLASLVLNRIVLHFPYDSRGRFQLKTAVLLNRYEAIQPLSKDRELCLAVTGPDRRSDAQMLHVELLELIPANQSHRWEDVHWYWQGGKAPETELLGVPNFRDLKKFKKAATALDRLQAQDFNQVFHSYRILADQIQDRIQPDAQASMSEEWYTRMTEVLQASAPWRWRDTIKQELDRLEIWYAQKKSRRRRAPFLKLANLPGKYGARKPGLYLTGTNRDSHVSLVIQMSGTNARLCETKWKRPIAVDFIRHGIESPLLESYPVE